MRNITILSSLLITLLLGCKSTALVTCNNIDKFESRSGVINTPFLNMGDLLIIDTLKKTGSFIGHIDLNSNDISSTNPIDEFEIISKTDFTISLSGKITKSTDLAATAKNSINNSSTFFLKNSIRKNIKDPIAKITGASIRNTIINTLKENNHSIVMFVTNLVYAEQIKLRLSKVIATSANVNVIQVGNIDLNVNYNCNDALNAIATQNNGSGVFFKGSFFQLNKEQTDLMFMANGISLGGFDLTHGK
jgi:hypothetical protein